MSQLKVAAFIKRMIQSAIVILISTSLTFTNSLQNSSDYSEKPVGKTCSSLPLAVPAFAIDPLKVSNQILSPFKVTYFNFNWFYPTRPYLTTLFI
jgi:hypothetical protein